MISNCFVCLQENIQTFQMCSNKHRLCKGCIEDLVFRLAFDYEAFTREKLICPYCRSKEDVHKIQIDYEIKKGKLIIKLDDKKFEIKMNFRHLSKTPADKKKQLLNLFVEQVIIGNLSIHLMGYQNAEDFTNQMIYDMFQGENGLIMRHLGQFGCFYKATDEDRIIIYFKDMSMM